MPEPNADSQAAGSTPAASAFWSRRWGWPQVLVIVAGCGLAAAAAQALFPHRAFGLPAAASVPVVAAWCGAWLLAGAVGRSRVVVRGIGGSRFGMAALAAVALLALPAAVFGWRASLASMPMAVTGAMLLANLSACVGRRSPALRRTDVAFLITHGGLLVVFAAVAAGRPRIERGALRLVEAGAAATSLELGSGTTVALPFSVRLLDFRMERYAPTLTLARRDPATGTWAVQAGRRSLIPGQTERLGDYAVRVEEYLVRARVDGDGTVLACDSSGAGPAARVAVTDSAGQPVAEGWLHAASWFGSDLFQRLAEGTVLLLDPGKPKQFASTLELGLDGRAETVAVAVNQPARRHGWTLMQSGYDAEAGPASRLSVIDVGRDRSLPFIHVGIGLVLVGVILMALAPNRKRPEAA